MLWGSGCLEWLSHTRHENIMVGLRAGKQFYCTLFNYLTVVGWGAGGIYQNATLKPLKNYLKMERIPITKNMLSRNLPYFIMICYWKTWSSLILWIINLCIVLWLALTINRTGVLTGISLTFVLKQMPNSWLDIELDNTKQFIQIQLIRKVGLRNDCCCLEVKRV